MNSDNKPNTKKGRTNWQLKQIAQGKCVVCGQKAAKRRYRDGRMKVLTLCLKHCKDRTERSIKRYYERKKANARKKDDQI